MSDVEDEELAIYDDSSENEGQAADALPTVLASAAAPGVGTADPAGGTVPLNGGARCSRGATERSRGDRGGLGPCAVRQGADSQGGGPGAQSQGPAGG